MLLRPRKQRAVLAVCFALMAALIVPYVLIDDEPYDVDGAARAAEPGGASLVLSSGETYYEVAGPEGGRTVVLVHGTTIPSFVWDRNFHRLAEAGFRVVRYDLYGRGLSARPEALYDLDLYTSQLAELLARVAPEDPVDLVGLSLGGMVITEFARRRPERVGSLVLIGPGGVGTELPLVARIATAPVIGEYLMRVAGASQLRPSRRMLLHPERAPDIDAVYLPTIRFRGSRRAVVETLRRVPYNGYEYAFRDLGELRKRILLVWGRQDRVVPFSSSDRVRELVRPARFLAVDEAGHLAHYERPDVVNDAMIDFLVESAASTGSPRSASDASPSPR